ncbi:transporter substrate-binding domain-containing protein [Pseudomonas stutzeri]|uniref:Amino acid ABC transporter substrate-binding protein n=1 Tax=Stutzerimonas stutzeri KOS6 TaxID=1218352 RepID=A0A061JS73_STUST|nr:transporter substrate-binding domain-containing protein [Stutzerimonas stutzeri]EWC42562.1 amino acid ABC transporter substrate-binding protein [Stutzerimonas stutzeri KOS6]MBK3869787.1 transporter substrate-binding domain-containing protein [Stutzerimonas stutzeri]
MAALPRLVLWLAWLMPAALLAEPMRVQLPEHRVLSSSETESLEPALAEQLAGALGRPMQLVAEGAADADVRMLASDQRGGSSYYRAMPAALVATEGGPAVWSDLRNQPVCISSASPYSALLSTRFAALPREYPSAAHALIGLKLGECRAVVDDDVLLAQIAALPEWRRYKRLLPALSDAERQLRLSSDDAGLQRQIDTFIASWSAEGRLAKLTQQWIDEVAFQAYVLADTLDCH